MRRMLWWVVPVLVLNLGCGKDHEKLTSPKLSSTSNIDSLVFSLPAIATHSSGDVRTESGTTSYWAGRPMTTASDTVTDGESNSEVDGGTRWVCQQHERNVSAVNSTFPLLDENADVIWPGAALQGRSLYRATPDPITAPRGPGVLIWSQINGSTLPSVRVASTTRAAIKHAADSLLLAQPSVVPADVEVAITSIRSREDLQIALQASADWFGMWGASASFGMTQGAQYNYFLVAYRQKLFTLVFERPELPHQFFADGVSLTEIAPHIGPDNPPAYVSEVTYGRALYLLVRSTEDEQTMKGTLDANFNLGLFGSEVNSNVDYVTSLRGLETQWYVYGGVEADFTNAVGGGLNQLKAFKEALRSGNNFRLAKPIFSTIRSVATDELVQNGYNNGYTYRNCRPIAIGTPTILTPQPGARLSNGCYVSPHTFKWDFSWTAVNGALGYELVVSQHELGVVADITTTSTSRTISSSAPFSRGDPDRNGNLSDWSCAVRTKVDGGWGPWSEPTRFVLERVGTFCQPRVVLYEHPNYNPNGGTSRTFYLDEASGGFDGENVPDLDDGRINFADVASSMKIFDLAGVRVYDGRQYTGQGTMLSGNHPDLRNDGWNDIIGSLKLVRGGTVRLVESAHASNGK